MAVYAIAQRIRVQELRRGQITQRQARMTLRDCTYTRETNNWVFNFFIFREEPLSNGFTHSKSEYIYPYKALNL